MGISITNFWLLKGNHLFLSNLGTRLFTVTLAVHCNITIFPVMGYDATSAFGVAEDGYPLSGCCRQNCIYCDDMVCLRFGQGIFGACWLIAASLVPPPLPTTSENARGV